MKSYGRRERNISCLVYEPCRVQHKAARVVTVTRERRPKSISEDDGMTTLVASSMDSVAWIIFRLYSTRKLARCSAVFKWLRMHQMTEPSRSVCHRKCGLHGTMSIHLPGLGLRVALIYKPRTLKSLRSLFGPSGHYDEMHTNTNYHT